MSNTPRESTNGPVLENASVSVTLAVPVVLLMVWRTAFAVKPFDVIVLLPDPAKVKMPLVFVAVIVPLYVTSPKTV